MLRRRRAKKLIIAILLVAVTSLSIGLATFSNKLTISSSATVKPNAGEYKLTIYGFIEDPVYLLLGNSRPESLEQLLANHTTTTYSVPGILYNNTVGSPATIDNNTFTIKDIAINFIYNQDFDGTRSAMHYLFILINEGAYDIYFNTSQIKELISVNKTGTCTTNNSEKEAIVNEHCNSIYHDISLLTLSSDMELTEIKEKALTTETVNLSPGDNIMLNIAIIASELDKNIVAETGEFTVRFEDIVLPFGSITSSSE